MRRFYNKGAKGLSGGQVKLDKMGNNDGKISGEDFAVIRSKKMDGGMMEEAKEINSKIKNSRTLKMGGGMMKRMGLKKGTVIEQGPPGTEGQYNKAAKDRLSTIVKNKKTLKSTNPKISQAKKDKARKQNKFLQGGDGQNFKKPIKQYASGGRVKRAAGGPGLYANIKAKKDRIAGGSGETMRKVGTKGAPTAQNFINAAKTAKKV